MRRSLSDFQVGEPFGRYDLLFPVAEGGMSRVWAARLRGTRGFQKVVALKTLLANGSDGHTLEQLLLDEARHASAIQHANVAQYLDVGEQDGVLFLVMEWLDGESLSRLLKNARKTCGIPLSVAIEIVAQVCKGLHAAHELRDENGRSLGLVHCDVSPQNIMLTSAGTAKLIDFGVARATLGGAAGTNSVTGKLSFMAPEQIRGRDFDRRADLFSLGIVLYLLATGQHPFPGKTPREIMNRIRVGDTVRPPSELVADFPAELEQVILRALSHSPNDRFETAAEMLVALLRAAPERAEEHELAAFVEQVCKDELEAKRREIVRALSLTPEQEAGPMGTPPSSRRLPLSELSPPSSTVPATAVTASIPTAELRPRRKGKLLLAGLFALAVSTGAVASRIEGVRALILPEHRALTTLSAKAAAERASASPAPLPSASATEPVEQAHPLPPLEAPQSAASVREAAPKTRAPRNRAKSGRASKDAAPALKETKVVDRYGI
jgi:serine/threonine protein kinase